MSFRRRQFLGWGALAAAAGLCAAWLLHLDYRAKISTDVLDLIPAAERSPELAVVRELASEAEAKTMFFVLTDASGAPAPADAATLFAAELVKSGAFEEAMPPADPAVRDAVARELFDQRFTLLFPSWLDQQRVMAKTDTVTATAAAHRAADDLAKFLSTPEAVAFQDLIPSDPLLLMPGLAKGPARALQDSAPSAGGAPTSGGPTLVWAELSAPPLTEAGQGPAFAAIKSATDTVRLRFPGIVEADTGVNRFAAASRMRIEREVSLLNTLSLVAVLAVALVFLRSAWRSLHLAPVLALSMLGAWTCVTLAFPRVHILVFAIGSLLAGVAIDYGFYLYMQPPLRPNEPYGEKVRRLLKPLLASCLTTVAGFALLLLSDLPLIRQLGLFVGSGLVCALAAAIVYFATVPNPYLEARTLRRSPLLDSDGRRWVRRVLIALWIASLPGLFRMSWKDDIRQLDIPSPGLQAEDRRIRALFGDGGSRSAFLSYGSNLADARASVASFETWVHQANPGATTAGLADAIPTAEAHARALQFFRDEQDFPQQLRSALTAGGFEAGAFAPFFEAYESQAARARAEDLPAAIGAMRSKLKGPLGLLVHDGRSLSWFVTLVANPPTEPPPPETRTVAASQLQTLNSLFARYRAGAVRLSLFGLAMVGAGVLLTYGMRDGIRIFAIPCGACLGLFGILGWLGLPLNIFHLLGAFLGVCLTHNYSIFSVTSAYRREPPPVSVRLSAVTAAASFGVLTLSSIPVVRALGMTVSLMVLAALLVIEFEHFAPIARKR